MKQTHSRNTLVKMGLLGMGTLLGGVALTSPAFAAPNRNTNREVKQERRDVKEARKDVRQERRDVQRANTPGERREARENLRDARQDLRREQRDVRQERRENQREQGRPGWNSRPGTSYDHPGYGYDGNYGSPSTLTGIVVREYTNDRFEMRVGGRLILVEPRGAQDLASHDTGDLVRVYGVSRGNTFIADNLSVVRNG